MTFIYVLNLYSNPEIHRIRKNVNFLCQGFRKLSSERQTNGHDQN